MIGQLQILALREHARHSLGAGFSLRKFHNRILAAGSLPLAVLAQEVEFWIQAEQASN